MTDFSKESCKKVYVLNPVIPMSSHYLSSEIFEWRGGGVPKALHRQSRSRLLMAMSEPKCLQGGQLLTTAVGAKQLSLSQLKNQLKSRI